MDSFPTCIFNKICVMSNKNCLKLLRIVVMSGRRDRSRSPQRGGFGGRDRYKILLKNLPYEVNWQKLKVSFYIALRTLFSYSQTSCKGSSRLLLFVFRAELCFEEFCLSVYCKTNLEKTLKVVFLETFPSPFFKLLTNGFSQRIGFFIIIRYDSYPLPKTVCQ